MRAHKLKPSLVGAPIRFNSRQSEKIPRAWVAIGRLDIDGRRTAATTPATTTIFAVSVNSAVSTAPSERIDLMAQIARILVREVQPNSASLWAFPGGYFGFDAERGDWLDVQSRDFHDIERDLRRTVRGFPPASVITFGVDASDIQQAWVVDTASGNTRIQRITRHATPLSQRIFSVGHHHAAVFVCGEFTGSRTENNGPFFVDPTGHEHFLNVPERQLSDCHILVDLAHQRISGTIHEPPNRRMVHQRQMERFSHHGVAVLTHHHDGKKSNGRAQSKHQSNWIVFPEKDWLSDTDVIEIP